jgi:N-(2-amino-2-carboxyethyl)-L-glutamate synthase
MISSRVYDLVSDDIYLRVPVADLQRFYLKIEGLNPAGSIKLKAARGMIDGAQELGVDLSRTRLIESTSGNLGIALAAICAARQYALTCVVDANTNAASADVIRALGAEVVTITERDANGGFLGSRIAYIQARLAVEPDLHWLNQYANPDNPAAHAQHTAPAVLEAFGQVDELFVGSGTCGTLMGCVEYFRRWSPTTRIVAVDAEGSVTFGYPPEARHIPGLGTSRRPEILDADAPDDVVHVAEWETVRECRWLARTVGLLAGGSTGTVLAAVRRQAEEIDPLATVVAISPDLGERYLSTVYDDEWVVSRGLGRALTEPIAIEEASQRVQV